MEMSSRNSCENCEMLRKKTSPYCKFQTCVEKKNTHILLSKTNITRQHSHIKLTKVFSSLHSG